MQKSLIYSSFRTGVDTTIIYSLQNVANYGIYLQFYCVLFFYFAFFICNNLDKCKIYLHAENTEKQNTHCQHLIGYMAHGQNCDLPPVDNALLRVEVCRRACHARCLLCDIPHQHQDTICVSFCFACAKVRIFYIAKLSATKKRNMHSMRLHTCFMVYANSAYYSYYSWRSIFLPAGSSLVLSTGILGCRVSRASVRVRGV